MGNFITPECQVSFVNNLDTPKAIGDSEPKYGCVLLFDADVDLKALKKAALDTAVEKWGAEKAKKMVKQNQLKLPFRDRAEKDWAAGDGTYMSVQSGDTKPGMLNPQKQAVDDTSAFWSGWIVQASLRPYAWSHPQGGNGVSFGLQNIWFKRPGERLDGRRAAEDDFASFDPVEDDDWQPGEQQDALEAAGIAEDDDPFEF